jgi:hypothetical protein
MASKENDMERSGKIETRVSTDRIIRRIALGIRLNIFRHKHLKKMIVVSVTSTGISPMPKIGPLFARFGIFWADRPCRTIGQI